MEYRIGIMIKPGSGRNVNTATDDAAQKDISGQTGSTFARHCGFDWNSDGFSVFRLEGDEEFLLARNCQHTRRHALVAR